MPKGLTTRLVLLQGYEFMASSRYKTSTLNLFPMRFLLTFSLCFFSFYAFAQTQSPPVAIDLDYNTNFRGFELFQPGNNRVFIIAEDVHNRIYVPALTLKFLQYLHTHKNIRTLCIEGGTSTAYLINRYLTTQDSTLLREIVRHTFYWSKEHHLFLKNLATWNNSLPASDRITVRSADIEIKQESVILALNLMMKGKKIPPVISSLETFNTLFSEKEKHKEQYQALNVEFYYNKQKSRELVDYILSDIDTNSGYQNFFGEDFTMFKTMMIDLKSFYKFNYKRDSKFKFRDDIIHEKLIALGNDIPEGFLYVVGARHTRPGSSSFRLRHEDTSPLKNKVVVINTTGKVRKEKYMGAKAVSEISTKYPEVFASNAFIKNENAGGQYFDYTLAFNTNRHVAPFANSYTGK